MVTEKTCVYGKHVVKEVLSSHPQIVTVVHIADTVSDGELSALLKRTKIAQKVLNIKKLPHGVDSDAVHQGIIAEIDSTKIIQHFDDFIRTVPITNTTCFALLGEVQDPHNVGAIIRSAAAFGITAVLIPEHRQAQITGTVIKVSAGTAFRMPLVQIGNVNQTIASLKEKGFWIYGLEGSATHSLADESFERPTVLVLGNEATGIRQKTLEHCDIALRIPIHDTVESLNASVAAAVVFYAWSRQHS